MPVCICKLTGCGGADILAAEGHSHLLVTHKSLMRAMMCVALGLPTASFRAVEIHNGGVSVFRWGRPRLSHHACHQRQIDMWHNMVCGRGAARRAAVHDDVQAAAGYLLHMAQCRSTQRPAAFRQREGQDMDEYAVRMPDFIQLAATLLAGCGCRAMSRSWPVWCRINIKGEPMLINMNMTAHMHTEGVTY